MTYSIVARDAVTGELGVAVQSRWFSVGSVVPWAEPGLGAVATQSFAEIAHGPNGLTRLRAGDDPAAALAALLATDDGEATRQVGIVDAQGRSAAHTGSRCVAFAGHRTAPDVAVQANMMERETVPDAMLTAFTATRGDLATRMLAALVAAEAEGGDVRGRQSASLLVVPGLPADPWTRRFDLRVEDHRVPLEELARILRVARAYEAMGEAERLGSTGHLEAAFAASERAHALAPEDDQLALWHAMALVLAGREDAARAVFAAASAVEPRAGEHLRRFAKAGHLPEAERVLDGLMGDRV